MGKNILALILSLTINLVLSQESNAQNLEGYTLSWSDEFNNNGSPNPNYWNFETGFVRNFEAQWYQAENAFCKDGFLIIEGKRELKRNPNFSSYNNKDWRKNRDSIRITSSCLITKNKLSWKYGKFVMRAKIPAAMGMWPAFWTLGVNGSWPSNGEIDIMEYYREDILANAAWESEIKYKAEWDDVKIKYKTITNDSADNQFHLWTMDWDENSISLYMDDKLINQIDLKKTINKTNGLNPFHQPHYILINLAIGGSQGGDPTYSDFPSEFVIDYIRVYQKKG